METNFARCFPNMAAAEQKRTLNQSLHYFAKGLSFYVHIPTLCNKGMDNMVTLVGWEHIDGLLKKKKGAICVTAHYGFWEIMAIHVTRFYPKIAMLARPLDNPLLDQLVNAIRSSGGGAVISSHRAFKDSLRLLKNNGVLGILIDQNFAPGGVFVDFMGRLAATAPVASILAHRSGCGIVPMHNRWVGNKVEIICGPPLVLSENPNLEEAIAEDTQAMAKIVEQWVREDPAQWFWMHNRWKRQPKPGEPVYAKALLEAH